MPRKKLTEPTSIKAQENKVFEEFLVSEGLETGCSGLMPTTDLATETEDVRIADPDHLEDAIKRITLLEKKAMIACQICADVCPQKAVTRVEQLDTESKGFTIKQSITVSMVREIQRVYGQIVTLALGHEAGTLYKVFALIY